MEKGKKKEEASKRHYALLDVLLLIFWFLLTGDLAAVMQGEDISLNSVFIGILAASTVTLTVHEFVIRGEEREKESIKEYLISIKNILNLFIDISLKLIVANAVLIYQAITLDINPRIVRAKVDLTSEAEVTLISLLITLLPGTLVIDVEEENKEYYIYVHYSYLKAEKLSENMKKTVNKWDGQIRGVFK